MTLARYLAPLLALAAAPALAQMPQPAAQRAAGPVQVPGVSAAGNAALQRMSGKTDPNGIALVREMNALQPQLAAILNAPTLDLVKLDAALKRKQVLSARAQALQDGHTIELLRALPPADRKPFLAAMIRRSAPPTR